MGEVVKLNCEAGSILGVAEQEVTHFRSIRHLQYRIFGDSELSPAARIDALDADPGAVALSVTVPTGTPPGADLPVLVYIHGGRYETGSHEDPRTQGDAFARAGVVTVTLGYRLGLPGFIRFHDDVVDHYRGVDDVLHGLKWVQRNIEEFGGDPTNVTLAGQSAGAGIALWLTRRDHFRGEFRRVMAMSPAFPRQTFEQRKGSLRAALGKPIIRSTLSETSPAVLSRGYRRFRNRHITDMALGPALFEGAELSDIPILLSTTREEFHHHQVGRRVDAAGPLAAITGVRTMGKMMGLASPGDYLKQAKEQIPAEVLARQFLSDSLIRRWVARAAEDAPGPVWLREYAGTAQDPALHSRDVPLLFHNLGEGPRAADPRVREVAQLLHLDALRFIRGELPGWSAYSPAQGRVAQRLNISEPGAGFELVSDPLEMVRSTFR
ncbi:Carboxylesterase [Corynebacterium occultum]|uniref:Carboxylic ester hydrolase n=1 Tax=Corynebacterium occultum TaxID=2675219 RepID=A0A6B8W7N7_9CORY|nr:carboxylesterase family protein [Corynebacterium occultum]QGU07937.1 Carboxylesterase [Corynebacterium occultum]